MSDEPLAIHPDRLARLTALAERPYPDSTRLEEIRAEEDPPTYGDLRAAVAVLSVLTEQQMFPVITIYGGCCATVTMPDGQQRRCRLSERHSAHHGSAVNLMPPHDFEAAAPE